MDFFFFFFKYYLISYRRRRSALLILYYTFMWLARGRRIDVLGRDVFINVVSDITRLGGFFVFFSVSRRRRDRTAARRCRQQTKNPEGNLLVTLYQISRRRRDAVIDLGIYIHTRTE